MLIGPVAGTRRARADDALEACRRRPHRSARGRGPRNTWWRGPRDAWWRAPRIAWWRAPRNAWWRAPRNAWWHGPRWRGAAGAVALALALAAPATLGAAGPQLAETGAVEPAFSARALLDRYCVACHNQQLRTAGLTLDTMNVGSVAARPDVWEKVVRKLRGGLMPPVGRPRPDARAYDELARWLEVRLDRAAAVDPHPGRSDVLHRLNRTEYVNAIRDLLALEIDGAELLPSDDASYGFDNIASSLRISPTHLDRYLAAARKISRAAVGRAAAPPTTRVYTVPADLSQERHLEGLPLGTRGGILVRHHFPRDGEYEFRAKLALDVLDNIPRYDETHHLDILIDGDPVERFTFAGEPDPEDLEPAPISDVDLAGHRRNMDAHWRLRVAVPAGVRDLAATFVGSAEVLTEASRTGALQPLRLALKEPLVRPYAGGFFNDEARTGPYLANLTVTGPFAPGGPGDTPSRGRIFTCTPAAPAEEEACAERILSTLARRAYRRPPSVAELDRLLDRYRDGRRGADFEAGIERALRPCGTCSPIPRSCSASSENRTTSRPTPPTRSPTWSWPRGCRSSSGAASRTTSCSTWRNAAACATPRCWTGRCGEWWPIRGPTPSSPISRASGCTCGTCRK